MNRAVSLGIYEQILEHGLMVLMELEIPTDGRELRLAVLDNQTDFIGTLSKKLGN